MSAIPPTTLPWPDGTTRKDWPMLRDLLLTTLQDATPVRTGRLRAGWRVRSRSNGLELQNEVPYASYVDGGTPRMDARNMTGAGAGAVNGWRPLGDLA